jgi:hypothetical protein
MGGFILFRREAIMAEPTVVCPNCKTEIRLTESLAAPLLESLKRVHEQQLAQKDVEAAAREKGVREREEAVKRAQATVDQQLADRLRAERARIAAEEGKKAQAALALEMDQKKTENAELQKALHANNVKLAEAQKAQADFLLRERQLEDDRREMALTIQKGVQAQLGAVREKALADVEQALQLRMAERELKLAEKDKTIAAMKQQLEEVQRRAEQASPQLRGEVLELQLEAILRLKFPHDRIAPVPKGEFGGDVLHSVCSPEGSACGTILWESKRTKNWSDGWLAKLRDDQRAAKAEFAILISVALPKGVESFEQIGGIWIADPRFAVPLALALRQGLMDLAAARRAGEGQAGKMQVVYQYLTGPQFRQRVQAIVEKFNDLGEDLRKERRFMNNIWAKREKQIQSVIESTVGMYGDLQGIAGKALREIEEIKMLDDRVAPPGACTLWNNSDNTAKNM